jgi:hypothetical protein
MQNLSAVAEVKSSEQLEHEQLNIVGVQRSWVALHVVTQICVLWVSVSEQGRGR